jgi:anti-sigma regulatory factor (Ser/Thr protein kinase)
MSDGRPRGDLAPPVSRSAGYAPAPVISLGHAPAPAATSACPSPVAPAMPLQSHLELAAFPSAVSCARGHVRWVAREWGLAHLADTAELLASELVTNGIRASGRLRTRADLATVPVVRIQIVSDRASLVLRVWDGSDEMPVRKDVTPEDEGGRGLVLVANLGQDWGAYRERDGKVVWVVISGVRDI